MFSRVSIERCSHLIEQDPSTLECKHLTDPWTDSRDDIVLACYELIIPVQIKIRRDQLWRLNQR